MSQCAEFRQVMGPNSRYVISESGEIRASATTTITKRGVVRLVIARTLKQYVDCEGYRTATLWGKKVRTHRILAQTWLTNPCGWPEVNHKDGDKLNNALSNLEWCSRSHNLRHAWRTGLQQVTNRRLVAFRSGGNGVGRNAKLNPAKARKIKRLLGQGCTRRAIALQFGVSKGAIDNIVRGISYSYVD